MLDHFLGTELDPLVWDLDFLWGEPTISDSHLYIDSGSDLNLKSLYAILGDFVFESRLSFPSANLGVEFDRPIIAISLFSLDMSFWAWIEFCGETGESPFQIEDLPYGKILYAEFPSLNTGFVSLPITDIEYDVQIKRIGNLWTILYKASTSTEWIVLLSDTEAFPSGVKIMLGIYSVFDPVNYYKTYFDYVKVEGPESPPPEVPPPGYPEGAYNEGNTFALAPGDDQGVYIGTAVWFSEGFNFYDAPITPIHSPGCGYWWKVVGRSAGPTNVPATYVNKNNGWLVNKGEGPWIL